MKPVLLILAMACAITAKAEVFGLRFAYLFENTNTELMTFEGESWYVHQLKGIFVSDIESINLRETTDNYLPLKLEITLTNSAYERFIYDVKHDGSFPGMVVLSEDQIVGSFPVIQKNLPQTIVMPIRDPLIAESVYEALQRFF